MRYLLLALALTACDEPGRTETLTREQGMALCAEGWDLICGDDGACGVYTDAAGFTARELCMSNTRSYCEDPWFSMNQDWQACADLALDARRSSNCPPPGERWPALSAAVTACEHDDCIEHPEMPQCE